MTSDRISISCRVLNSRWCINSARRLINDSEGHGEDTCYGEVLKDRKGQYILFCRGEHFGSIGYISDQDIGPKVCRKIIKILHVDWSESGDPLSIEFTVSGGD